LGNPPETLEIASLRKCPIAKGPAVIQLVVLLIIIGVILWAVETLIPMDPTLKRIIYVVILLCVILYVIRFFGIF
jgi:vacuolar-type H+-ATPase subunit I/STV1